MIVPFSYHKSKLNCMQAGMKIMCRQGIPVQFRSEVWKRLIYGKISDMKQEKGINYFGHLMTRAYDSLVIYRFVPLQPFANN